LKELYKKYFHFAVKALITLGLLYFVFTYVSFENIKHLFIQSDLLYLALAFLLMPLSVLFQYYKWELICREYLNETKRYAVISSLFQGFAAGIFTPLRTGEYLARKIPFENSSFAKVTMATFLDKLSGMLALAIFGGLFFFLLLIRFELIAAAAAIFLSVFLIGAFVFAMFFLIDSNKWSGIVIARLKNFGAIKKLSAKIESASINKSLLRKSFYFSIPVFLITLMQYSILYHAFDIQIGFVDGILSANAVLVIKNFIPPVTFGGTGVREAVSVFVFKELAFNQTAAVNSAILILIYNLIIPSAAGLYFTLRNK